VTPAGWDRIQELFASALERPVSGRAAFLDQAIPSDPRVRAEVQRLLDEHERAGSTLDAPAYAAGDRLQSGRVLNGRFRIVRSLGRGGMGEVYEAVDQELSERVAVKTIRPEIAADPTALARFRQEMQLARRITHPNICRLFDLHHSSDSPGAPLAFLTMELLEGVTLAGRLAREGRLSIAAALPIAQQLSDALTAAHQAGVIHRDFKSANVMLVPSPDAPPRTVVMDFGLAQSVAMDDSTVSALTRRGMVGTPDYMAPEQLEGGLVSEATDIYAFGVVLYEMVTGTKPFSGDSPLAVALQRLRREAPPPRSHVPDLDPAWDAAILRCLERDPRDRFSSASEIPVALASRRRVRIAPTRRRVLQTVSVLLVLLAGLASAWWFFAPYSPAPEAARWYDQGVSALRDGAYYTAGKMLQRAIQIDPKFALAHARLAESWAELDYVDKAKESLLRASPPLASSARLRSLDRLYLEALHLTITGDYAGALQRYQQIAREAPARESGFAAVDLGRAYEKASDPKNALGSYLDATRRSPQYAAAFLRLGAAYARQQNWSAAEEAFSRASGLYDAASNIEGKAEVLYQRSLAADAAGRFAEARPLLEETWRIAQTAGDPHQQIKALLLLSSVAYKTGDTGLAQQRAKTAVDLAQSNGIENLTTRGLQDLGTAVFVSGDYPTAEGYFQQALALARRYHSRRLEARSQFMLASLWLKQGRTDDGLTSAEQALAFYEPAGFRREAASLQLLIGRARRDQGDYEAALRAFEQSRVLAERASDRAQLAVAHESLGSVLLRQEHYPEALTRFQAAYDLNSALGVQANLGYNALQSGSVLWRLGRYQEARGRLDEAAQIASRSGSKPLLAAIHRASAEMALSQRLWPQAMAHARQALEISSLPDVTAEAQLVLGLARAHSGNPAEGIRLCRLAVSAADGWVRSRAELALAEALLAAGDTRGVLALASPISKQAGQPESAWRAAVLLASAGDPSATQQAAQTITKLRQLWGAQPFDTYAARPDVQLWRKQLQQLTRTTP
jgi:tetratricopeptide (TPR) repeat protein